MSTMCQTPTFPPSPISPTQLLKMASTAAAVLAFVFAAQEDISRASYPEKVVFLLPLVCFYLHLVCFYPARSSRVLYLRRWDSSLTPSLSPGLLQAVLLHLFSYFANISAAPHGSREITSSRSASISSISHLSAGFPYLVSGVSASCP